jgi:Tfp pilus assembly protein PilF
VIIYRIRVVENRTHHIFEKHVDFDGLFTKPNYSECEWQLNVGLSYFKEDKLTEALFHFNRAMEFDSKSLFAVANIGSIYAIWGKKHQAFEYFNKALQIEPNHPQLLANKLELIAEMEETTHDEFRVTLNALLSANPIHPTALNYAIQLAFNDNDVARAIALVKIHHANYYMEKDHFALLKRFFEMFDDERGRNELLALYTSPMALAARCLLKNFIETYKNDFNWPY